MPLQRGAANTRKSLMLSEFGSKKNMNLSHFLVVCMVAVSRASALTIKMSWGLHLCPISNYQHLWYGWGNAIYDSVQIRPWRYKIIKRNRNSKAQPCLRDGCKLKAINFLVRDQLFWCVVRSVLCITHSTCKIIVLRGLVISLRCSRCDSIVQNIQIWNYLIM